MAYGERILKNPENEKKTLESAPDGMREDGASFILNGVRTLPVQTDEEKCSLEVVRGGLNTGIFGTNFSALFSSLKGGLVSYIYGGRELIEKIPRPNFWRAPTNNDEGCRMPARCGAAQRPSGSGPFPQAPQNRGSRAAGACPLRTPAGPSSGLWSTSPESGTSCSRYNTKPAYPGPPSQSRSGE